MAKRNVLKAFQLNTPDGIVQFAAGTQVIDEKYLGHWFVQAHLEPEVKEEDTESEEAEKKRLMAILAEKGITVGGNIKLETLRERVAKVFAAPQA